MNNEIKKILEGVKDGEQVLSYIGELEEKVDILQKRIEDNDEGHHHECHCHDSHDESCHCHDGNHDEGCHCHDNEENEWEEIKTPYENKLTVKDWEELLKNDKIFTVDALKLVKRMRHIAAPVSYMELADTFGLGAVYYGVESCKLAIKLISFVNTDNLKEEEYWTILFNAWKSKNEYETEIYALRPELYEALGNVDLSKVPLREHEI